MSSTRIRFIFDEYINNKDGKIYKYKGRLIVDADGFEMSIGVSPGVDERSKEKLQGLIDNEDGCVTIGASGCGSACIILDSKHNTFIVDVKNENACFCSSYATNTTFVFRYRENKEAVHQLLEYMIKN